jgi:hypothetical protein
MKMLHALMMVLISLTAFFGARYAVSSYFHGPVYDDRQGMVTADAPAHAAVTWIDASTFTHEALHATPLRKGDRLK